jgi:DNA-binding response OmpR family regulator
MFASVEKTKPVRRIVVVHDDAEIRDALMAHISLHDDLTAIALDSGAKGLQATTKGEVDLIIMNVGLPDVDGREAVRLLRKRGFKAPILLTGDDTDSATILGLESGANDYVSQPCRFPVLLARVRAQLRQHDASEDAVLFIGPYRFRPGSKMLIHSQGSRIHLSDKETALLRYLYRAARPVSRDTLLKEVWDYKSEAMTHTLETHVYRLRQKIEINPAEPTILVTAGRGYKLVP